MTTKIAKLITENAATHSFLINKLRISRATYYKKLKAPELFSDLELRLIARNSTLSFNELKDSIK